MPRKPVEKSNLAPWLAAALVLPVLLGGFFVVRALRSKTTVANAAPGSSAAEVKESPKDVVKKSVTLAAAQSSDAKHFTDKIQPFLATYCITCHNDKLKKGGMSLEKFTDLVAASKDRTIWPAAAEVLRAKEMPPKGKPQPTDAERAMFLEWADGGMHRVDCGLAKDPGRPTIRRLNKAEYNNTIRDLVGVKFQPADDFPTDDVGYGFDNIGDVLTLSPILLEKYMAAAEKILDQAIVIEKPIVSGRDTFRPQNFRASVPRPNPRPTNKFSLTTNAKVFVNFDFLYSGEYIIRGRVYGDRAGTELPKMAMQVDGKVIKTVDVDAEEGKPKTYEARTKISAGRHDVELAFTNDYEDKKATDSKKKDRNLHVELLEIEGPFNAVAKPLPETHQRIMVAKPGGSTTKEAAARKIIETFATKAYRRPATRDEVDRLIKLFKKIDADGEPFESSIQFVLRAVLVSPHFLFRIEKDADPNNPKAVHPVSDYELATRLSYFIWSSMPDDELFTLAGKGDLRKPGVIESQVKRMLASPKARALTDNFAEQWLNLRMIPALDPDPKAYPGFDASLKAAMITETEMYFEHIAKDDRSVLEFLDSDWTFVNKRLATHYGISGVADNEFKKVTLTDKNRGGVLMQASVLTLTSNPTRTSPVKRGKWILENILGTPPPPPPPNVPDLEEQAAKLTGSLRQQMEQHRTNSLCASCHQKMDPLGFGLENFDGVGGWRTKDGKYEIDASGVLPDGAKFDGPAQLRKVLLTKADLFRRNLADKLLTFALGRGLEYYDKCALDDIVKHLTDNKDRFSALVVGIVKSDPFQKRRGGTRE